jgi:hypothetical protein
MSNLNQFEPSALPLGSIIKIGDIPNDGQFAPVNSSISRALYPALSEMFPSPKCDNISWTTQKIGASYQVLAYGNSIFIIHSISLATWYTTTDGITLTAMATPPGFNPTGNIACGAYGNSTFVLIQGNVIGVNVCYTSSNGTTWTARTLPSTETYRCLRCINNTFFLFVSNKAYCYTSSDGITWTQRTLPVIPSMTGCFIDVAYGNGKYVMVGGPEIAISTDIITWSRYTFPSESIYYSNSFSLNYAGSIAFGNGIFVVEHGWWAKAVSTDGINWKGSDLNTSGSSSSPNVIFFNGYFFSTHRSGNKYISTDGIIWEPLTLDAIWWADTMVAGGNRIIIADSHVNSTGIRVGLIDSTLMKIGTFPSIANTYVKVN